MKQYLRSLAPTLALALVLASCASTSTPNQIAYRTVGSIVIAVDTAVQGFADATVRGQTTQAQQDAVRAAHQKYYQAASTEKIILQSTNQNFAPQDLTIAADNLVALINSFLKKG